MKSSSHASRIRRAPIVGLIAGLTMLAASFGTATAEPVGTVIDYEHTATAGLPPASSFGGSAGGDGWALGFDDTNVYNVFHHDKLKFACHNKVTAASCSGNGYTLGTKSVSDGSYVFRTPLAPPVYIDPTTNHMFTTAVKSTLTGLAGTTGIVEVDLSSTSSNPFVAFYPLSRDNEGACVNNNCGANDMSVVSNTSRVGTKWYVYNYVSGVASPALPDSRNKLLCFDFATKSACAGQPYNVATSGGMQGSFARMPSIAAVGNRIFINIFGSANVNTLAEIACVNVSSTPVNCSGWPINPVATTRGTATAAPPFPRLDSSGTAIGVCFPGDPNACTDFSGTVQTIPTALANLSAISNTGWATSRSEAHVYGTRMYTSTIGPSNNDSASINTISCYDFAIDDLCTGFPKPKSFTYGEMAGIYSIQNDPSYPSCIWVMGHQGTKQIQNFDYETGGTCGAGGSVLPVSNFLESQKLCEVRQWKTFSLVKPAIGNWTSGTVEFDDASGNAISGVPVQTISSNGTIDLTPLDLHTHSDLAKVRVKLVGATTPTIDVRMKWSAEWHPECVASGQTAFTSTTTSTIGATTTTVGATTTTKPDQVSNTDVDDNGPTDLPTTGSTTWSVMLAGIGTIAVGMSMASLGRRRRTTLPVR